METKQIKPLYLIQRGKFQDVKGQTPKISKMVDMDYMGSAEFEFGALPESLRRFEAHADKAVLRTLKNFNGEGSLYVFSYLSDEAFDEYVKQLVELRTKGMRLKELAAFNIKERQYMKYTAERTDFWWDIVNDVMFAFDARGKKVPAAVAESIAYMNSK